MFIIFEFKMLLWLGHLIKIMRFQKMFKNKPHDLNKCFYNKHFSENQIYKLAILNFSKNKKFYIILVTQESINYT